MTAGLLAGAGSEDQASNSVKCASLYRPFRRFAKSETGGVPVGAALRRERAAKRPRQSCMLLKSWGRVAALSRRKAAPTNKTAFGVEEDFRSENPDNAGQFRFARLNHGNPAWKSRSIFSTISVSKPSSMTSR
ncbi:protein of unknown function [Pseudomonas sp. JV551A1]|uniref:Uncharacterized protein n=1 Tax=Pseudomonas inefficax TaxID=2078786 RepID=A0AAQ1PAW1_9PSED|nr:protein of unknown function [Pseudomonas sp. JV551A1]SPO60950.1 protein of unknown function [Pseudomonas inefficax]